MTFETSLSFISPAQSCTAPPAAERRRRLLPTGQPRVERNARGELRVQFVRGGGEICVRF